MEQPMCVCVCSVCVCVTYVAKTTHLSGMFGVTVKK